MLLVAIQGIAGSFHHEAAEKLLAEPLELVSCKTFAAVFRAVRSGQADFGVAAIENSLYGSINAVYGLLAKQQLWVSAEVFLKIEQFLIAARPIPQKDFGKLEAVLSQAPALAQCEQWLDTHIGAVLEETHDTAASVQHIMRYPEKPLAAIAGKRAAERYGASVIAGPINDDPHNYTRFFLLQKVRRPSPDADKTSIILETGHTPGALYRALGVFAQHSINLSKLDSHPLPGDMWHYAFYIDFDASLQSKPGRIAVEQLERQGCTITVLGSYKGAGLPD